MHEELPGLRDLGTQLAERARRVEPPTFDVLVERAKKRRRARRTGVVAAAVAASVAVLGVGAAGVHDGTGGLGPVDAPGVSTPTARPTAEGPLTPRQRLRAMTPQTIAAEGRLVAWGANGDAVLTVHRSCVDQDLRCRYAWRLTDRQGVRATGGAGGGGLVPRVVAGDGGFVLQGHSGAGLLVRDDASTSPVDLGDPPLPAQPGDLAVPAGRGWHVVDPQHARAWSLPPPPGADGIAAAAVGADGTVWALPGWSAPGRVEVSALHDGVWTSHRVDDPTSDAEVPALLAVSGSSTGSTRVAVLTSYDGATVWPAGRLEVSTDGGTAWRAVGRTDLPFDTVDSMAATTDGTLFVAEPDGTLWRTDDGSWTHFARVRTAGPVGGLTPGGRQVLAWTASGGSGLVLLGADGSEQQVTAR